MIAALYVEAGGIYSTIPGVDPWDLERDARRYLGPHPVVAHPPCKRWGNYWYGGSSSVRKRKGDDKGCFKCALTDVRTWGGVLEHPRGSRAWAACGLSDPPSAGGWVRAGDGLGWTCCVEQGHYGHRAQKATWLYAVRCDLPDLAWGPSGATFPVEHMAKPERAATPRPFAGLLVGMARTAVQQLDLGVA